MKRVLFHEGVFSQGGTTKSLLEYAVNNEKILNNKSFLAFHKIENTQNKNLLENKLNNLKNNFEILIYSNYEELENYIKAQNIQYHYEQKSGEKNGFLSTFAKNCIHAVFPQNSDQIHGQSYAFISEWLSKHSQSNIPYVPYIVNRENNSESKKFREIYNIPEKAKVFGRIGSYNEFNIDFVFNSINEALNLDDNIWFVFINTPNFIEHERVLFLPAIFNESEKANFVEGCDAMIHARIRGETFGLAISEFSVKNKPVFTYKNSPEQAHLDILKDQAILYDNEKNLIKLFLEYNFTQPKLYNAYQQFNPLYVMEKFDKEFLK
jgi:hypothetical protein